MKTLLALGCFASILIAACGDATPATNGTDSYRRIEPWPAEIREELIALGAEDQAPRQNLTPARMQDTTFLQQLLRGDSARSHRLQELVTQYGWPNTIRAGPAAAQAAFLLLQHSPLHGFQQELLPEVETLARAGAMPAADVAMLTDRVLVRQGSAQRYGTQFDLRDGQWVMHPVEDEAALDQRRSEMGLPPLDEYMRQLEQFYGAPAVRR
jgi:hypothetical protein